MLGPGMANIMKRQNSQEDHAEDAGHTRDGLHAYVVIIRAILLVKAVGVFDLQPATGS